ncbi:MAG: Stp1/IreP family PP2C-type Ser/Thr phosphatase [Clostridia bacterium]|nr:Stp1/IreP family PP2C-type Ser/Thr phosphatase [Clostridia bacterium]MBR4799433.1 Stp1/IreP family PP2C-type Ser/Thr phosphatase [Clostridia bacterium]MBR5746873.1 Stp1/IreP family PP2C-type Ser/Thr phosphatase [Clostridia bacterium]
MKFYGRTDIGLKRRNNQDSYAVFARDGYVCAIVCDGMGGAKGGNVASGTAVKAFASVIRKTFAQKNAAEADARTVKALLRSAADAANREVYEKAVSDDELDGMGTTIVAVLCTGAGCFAINIGDSRIYKRTAAGIKQVSKDHSFVQYLIDKGEISPAEAAFHPNKNIILRALGVNSSVEGDCYTIKDYEQLLLCTDGLTNHLSDLRIEEIMTMQAPNGRKASLKARVDKMIEEANAEGGSDNITAVLIEKD